ncbi:Helix-turn-helix/peptidase S24-like domain protein [Xenorhabdus bovienii str. puntauvense]|uniref:Helix-turn-helix/peptidase S24-like domain protein n=1 Tax=Xenorhabdus bovienii str. puntauvense TaxID=1398201 RepID=A0A077N0G1_XENBV|nr:LexA family transcriptional regulator [Xenorhabdus bovienii]CDG95576.1 Helix-turn-helix/peptidase S24-like domain protein [Xenorhabdus bovienii str. puntauvense]
MKKKELQMKKFEINEEFHTRISSMRAENSLTQAELAALAGVSQRQIAAYEGHESKPRQGVLKQLAKALGTTPEWLAIGEGESGIENLTTFSGALKKVPIIPLDKVIDWITSQLPSHITSEYYPTCYGLSDWAFAVRISDPAMATSGFDNLSFPKNSLVIFEPAIDPENQDFVIAIMPNGKFVFRQYISNLRTSTLMPLDSRYPQEQIESREIENKEIMLIPAVSYEITLPALNRIDVLNN